MGSFHSTTKRLDEIEKSLRKIDVNGDGVVSKKELETAIKNIKTSDDHILKLKNEVEKYKREYNSLKEKHDNVCKTIDDIKDGNIESHKVKIGSSINDKAVEDFVDDIINDPNTNIYGVPDILEREIYKKTIKSILIGAEKIFENSSIDIIGHKIQFVMRPV